MPTSRRPTLEDSVEINEKLPYKRYNIFVFANPRSGGGLAKTFLTDFPAKNSRRVYFSEYNQTVDCAMNFYNVLEGTER